MGQKTFKFQHATRNIPLRVITATAPIRICDNGGWTDTWFAEHGKIFNIAVTPYVEVQIEVFPNDPAEEQILLYAENYGERYPVHPERPGWGQHPLLEAAIARMGAPQAYAVQITVFSEAPGGCATGTSAAVSVALIAALDRLTPGRLSPHEIAYAAHAVEVDMLKQQSGIQDQLCSAYGGINFIEMTQYPHATVSPIHVAEAIGWELEHRLALIYLGQSHISSDLHLRVIKELENAGSETARLQALRVTAVKSRDAVYAGDFVALGQAMIENTEAQGRLHPDLVGRDAQAVIAIAREFGAPGWKVNGAGGEGGSVTLLCPPQAYVKRELLRAIEAANPRYKNIPIRLSRHGVQVWEHTPRRD